MNFRVTGLRAVAVLKSKFHSDCSSQVESYVRLNEMEPKKNDVGLVQCANEECGKERERENWD